MVLAAAATTMIAATAVAGTLHVGSRRRLHPLFALGAALTDLSVVAARTRIRNGGRRLATMAGWIRHRR